MAILGSLFVLLIGRLGHVQLIEGPPAARGPVAPTTRTVTETATRGTILDRQGRPLVGNRYTTTVTVPRSVLLDAPDGGRGLVAAVSKALQRPFEDLWGKTMLCGTAGAPPAPACFNGSRRAGATSPANRSIVAVPGSVGQSTNPSIPSS